MLKKYLEILSNNDIEVIRWFQKIKYNWKNIYINPAIFDSNFTWDLIKYKNYFIEKINNKKDILIKIWEEVFFNNYLIWNDLLIFKNELNTLIEKANFLIKVYDIEANKIDHNYKIKDIISDYDYYNSIFFNTSKKDIKKTSIEYIESYSDILFTKDELLILLNKAKNYVPWLKYEFWNFWNLSHYHWTLRIPDSDTFNIRTIIVIFFHEMTHFFRYLNWLNNLGFNYSFSDYVNFEEWLANFNEIKYWNQIIEYWDFIPYYNISYSILLEDISIDNKIEKIYQLLKNKWFNRKKSKSYFYRFYKFSKIWWKDFFLKDLIYSKSYKLISEYLKDFSKYEKLMAWKIWLCEYENNLISPDNNFDSIWFFEIIKNDILTLSKNKWLKF